MSTAHRTSKSAEWGTPADILVAVQLCLRGIELDPCSSAAHNDVVKAKRYYTAEDDGLSQSWEARTLFCNPPGSPRGVQRWWSKFTEPFGRDRIWLGFNMNQLAYLEPNPLQWAEWIFIPRQRLKFRGAGDNPPHNSYLVGRCPDRCEFDAIPGTIVRLW